MKEQFKVGKLYRKTGGGNIIGPHLKLDLNDIVLILKINQSGEDYHFYNSLDILFKEQKVTILQPPLWWEEVV